MVQNHIGMKGLTMYQHEVYIPCAVGRQAFEDAKTLLTNIHGGCTAYHSVGHWNNEGTNTDGTTNSVQMREEVWVVRVVSDDPTFSGLNLIEAELFKRNEKCVMSTTQEISARFNYDS